MHTLDAAGHRISAANDQSLKLFEQAAHELRCMTNDPLATVDAAIAARPGMPIAHALKAWLSLLGTDPGGDAAARVACDGADLTNADARERGHINAARALADGRWADAGAMLEDLSLQHPRDALALQVGHQIDFFRGDSRMLRDRIARALPAWDAAIPGYHAVLGMHAFGLEETGDYEGAIAQGQRALELQPHDSWAWHALAHVHEMRNAPRDGIALLEPTRSTWSTDSFLATHNTWHLALFHLELDRHDDVLALYDGAIAGESALVMDGLDAASMLWRLHLRGVDVGRRFDAVADRWQQIGGAGQYAFNDLHAMLAFVGADRPAQQQRVLQAMQAAAEKRDHESGFDNAVFTRDVGLPAAQAIQAFGQGDYARTAALLRPVRSRAHRFGGSHAQRDLLDLTLMQAALRSNNRAMASGLAAERLALRPRSLLAQRLAGTHRVG